MERPEAAWLEAFWLDANYAWTKGVSVPRGPISSLRSLRGESVLRNGDVIRSFLPKVGKHLDAGDHSLIPSKGDPSWVRSVLTWHRSPWLECIEGLERVKNHPPKDAHTSTPPPPQPTLSQVILQFQKAIYIIRNPRDSITSGYYFWTAMKSVKNPESFEPPLQWLLPENVAYGSWFDRNSGWLTTKGKENFLVVACADGLASDIRSSVEVTSQFLGEKLSSEELNSVLKNVPSQVVKDTEMSSLSPLPDHMIDHSEGRLIRKGITGDRSGHFPVAQSETFDKIYQEKMIGLPTRAFPTGIMSYCFCI